MNQVESVGGAGERVGGSREVVLSSTKTFRTVTGAYMCITQGFTVQYASHRSHVTIQLHELKVKNSLPQSYWLHATKWY